jgi:hypothetical protein
VQNALNLAGASVPLPTLALYCVVRNTAATPPTTTLSGPMTAGQNCPSGNLPGTYVTITATYTYVPIMPFYSRLASTTLREIAYVRLF